jgi:hypothetical protein
VADVGGRWLQRELHTADHGVQALGCSGRSTPARCATRNRGSFATNWSVEVRLYHRRAARYHHHPPWSSRGRLAALAGYLVALLSPGYAPGLRQVVDASPIARGHGFR